MAACFGMLISEAPLQRHLMMLSRVLLCSVVVVVVVVMHW